MIYAENILICITVPLMISLIFITGKARYFAGSLIIGMVVCLIAAYISGYLDLAAELGEESTAIFISPIVEEIMKFLPLLFYVMMFLPESDDMYLVALGIGAGFATFENCCYILTSGAESLPYILIRGMAVGVMHIVSILVLAIGIEMVRRFRALSVPGLLGALSLSMTFHGLYNLLVSEPGLSSVIGYVLPLFTAIILYFPFRRMRKNL